MRSNGGQERHNTLKVNAVLYLVHVKMAEEIEVMQNTITGTLKEAGYAVHKSECGGSTPADFVHAAQQA